MKSTSIRLSDSEIKALNDLGGNTSQGVREAIRILETLRRMAVATPDLGLAEALKVIDTVWDL